MHELALIASCYRHPERPFVADVLLFDSSARSRRAFSGAGALLLGALATAPIPIVHLFATPGLLIAAIVIGVRRLREQRRLVAVRGACPACDVHVTITPQAHGVFPLTTPCPSCGEFLKLTEAG